MYLNKVLLIGNLTRDPELKALPSGIKVCSFSIATNRTFKDKDGVKKDATEFHNVVVFARVAELVAQYLKKGSQAYVEGRLQTRSWEQNGEKKYRTEIVAETVQFGSRPTGTGPATPSSPSKAGDKKGDTPVPSEAIEYPSEEINPDDIPF
ncbi:MAG: single-stranded DNA-binding protein [Candidatus Taylorbacteria bacterium]